VFTGPRVLTTMAQDYRFLAILAPKRIGDSPLLALGLQWAVVTVLLATAKFETVMKYIGITLSLFTCLTVIGMMRLRFSEPNLPRPFKTPLYPLTPILFLAANAWMIYYLGQSNLSALVASAVTIVSGLVIYQLIPRSAHTSGNA
jgi:basic amino acid/polyamine antiporter, APA family